MLDIRAVGCSPTTGFGTATLIDDTLALTAAHVVAGADSVEVIDLDGVEHEARIVWFDPDLDLAAVLVPAGVATMSESVVVFDLPATAGTFGVTVGAPGTGPAPAGTPVGTSKGEHYHLYFSVCGTTHIYTGNMSIFTVYSETWRFVRPDTDTPSVHTSF